MSDPGRLTPEQEERLARYRAGAMSGEERAAFEREAVASEALSGELYAELALDAVRGEGAAPVPTDSRASGAPPLRLPARGRRSRATWMALPVAATLVALSAAGWWLLGSRGTRVAPDVMRGNAAAAGLLEPRGTLESVPTVLRWNRAPGADHYRVELFDASGHGVGARVTADTTLAIDSLAHRPLEAGEWRVVPIDASGHEGPALGRETFRVRQGGR